MVDLWGESAAEGGRGGASLKASVTLIRSLQSFAVFAIFALFF